MSLPYYPKGTFVALEALEESSTSQGGIIIPSQYRHKVNQGIIVAFGPEVPGYSDCQLELGEIVVFPQHAEHRLKFKDKEYIYIELNQIICGDQGQFKNQLKAPLEDESPPSERRRPIGLVDLLPATK